jgi:hypothetical protein
MPRRSTRVTLSNNTDLTLTRVAAVLCHGAWTNDIEPPTSIAPKSCASWEAESSGVATGTEGWVKYQVNNAGVTCVPELVFIYWDNPFVWSTSTRPIDRSVTTSDVTPPCSADDGKWDGAGSVFPHGGKNPPDCAHSLVGVAARGNNQGGISWWDVVVNWPALLGLTVLGQIDINLEFTLALRRSDSLRETVFTSPCVAAVDSIRAVSEGAKQPSLRALFHM